MANDKIQTRKVVTRLLASGIKVKLEHGKLKTESASSALTPEMVELIKGNKEDLIDYLQQERLADRQSSQITSCISGSPDSVPLSYSQQRLWFVDKLQGGSAEYNMPMAIEVFGELDLNLVARVFAEIINRHQILRTTYKEKEGKVHQHIRSVSELQFDVAYSDFSHLSGEILELEVEEKINQELRTPFNLAEDLMLKAGFIKKASTVGILYSCIHHIASDGWSMDVFKREFFVLYTAFVQGKENPLPPLTFQFADYAQWQRDFLQGEVLASQVSYWEKQLEELPSIHGLCLDYKRPAIKQHKGGMVTGQLSDSVARNLLSVAKEHKLTPFMLLHGVLALLLSRHSNNNDIVIGTPVANRFQEELKPMIGFFVNTLVLRVDTSHDSMSDYYAHIRQVHLDAQSHQEMPFEQLVELLKVPRSTAHSPLFQIMITTNSDFALTNGVESGQYSLPDVDVKHYRSDLVQTKFDLNVDFSISEQGLCCTWIYDTSLFTEQRIVQLHQHLCRLLEGVSQTLGRSSLPLRALPMLSGKEIQHLVQDLNQTKMDYAKDKCVHQLFEQQVQLNPERIALIYEDKQLTYAQLNEKANQLAHYLTEQHSITPDTLIGLCVERSLEMVVGVIAILKTGACYVPFDIEHGSEIINVRLHSHRIQQAIFSNSTLRLLKNDKTKICNINEFFDIQAKQYLTENLNLPYCSESLAYGMTSSGTTGNPKLIGLPHRALNNLVAGICQENKALEGIHNVLQFASIGFDMSFTDMGLSLLQGGRLVLIPENTRFDVKAITALIEKNDISLLNLPASMVELLSDICVKQQKLLPSIKVILSTAEKLEISDTIKTFFSLNSDIKLVNHFGPTETHVCTTHNLPVSVDDWPQEVSIGVPLCNSQCYVLDGNQSLTPLGALGELWVGGDCLAVGYLGNEALTSDKFVHLDLPEVGVSRVYRTGDLVQWRNGQLFSCGRVDDQIKINGYRVELEDVKQQIKSHPYIENAVLLHDVQRGLLSAYFTSDSIDERQLRSWLLDKLPSYMVPRYLIKVKEFKLTVNGKIDKRALPELEASLTQESYVAPQTDIEFELTNIWSDLLNIASEQISVNSNFFELGGSSIMLVKGLYKIQQVFGINLTAKELYKNQALKALSCVIAEEIALQKVTNIGVEEPQWEI